MSKLVRAFASAWLLLVFTLGCDKIQTQDSFEIRLQAIARVPAGDGPAPLAFPGLGPILDVDLADRLEFTDRGYTADDAERLELRAVNVFAVQPPAQTLDFFGDLRVVIDTDGLPAVVAAQGSGSPTRQTALVAQGTDMRDYLTNRRGTISLQAAESQFPPVETTLRVELTFEVTIAE